MFPVMVLAAGLGTRLLPLSAWRPKPLAPIGDRTALDHALDRARAAQAPRLVVNAHHRADDLERALPADVRVSREAELLGTAGGVARAAGLIGEGPVLIWNADILAEIDLLALAAAHGEAAATLVVRPRPRGEGAVGLDAAGRVVRLRQQGFGAEERGGDFVGVHVLGAELRGVLPAQGCLVGDVYIPALARGATLRAFEHGGEFWDVGSLASYLGANLAWLAGRRSWCAPDAEVVDGVTLDRAVIGSGARVVGSGALERVVVWPGATAVAPLADAIVAPAGVVAV